MRNLILVDLREGMPALTFAAGERLAEAASRILYVVGQGMSMTLDVTGDHIESFRLERLPVDDTIRRTYDDLEEATEEGACGIAILLARELTGWSIVRRARKGTGFDYYLGGATALDLRARLEVSGIRQGTEAQVEARRQQKRDQMQSDGKGRSTMNQELEEKHNQAMALADQADEARHRRDLPQARQLLQEAFLLEKAVALQYAELPDAPSATVAILLRSAASLANEAGEPREAERLIARALAGDPPASLAEELRELWDQVRPQLRALQVA